MIYLWICAGLMVLGLALSRQRRLSHTFYPVVWLGLLLFCGFRWQVGCDWFGYFEHYLLAPLLSPEEIWHNREPGWWALLRLQHALGLGYVWINVAAALVCLGGLHWLARRLDNPCGFMALLFPLLLVGITMSGIRQAMAIGLVTAALVPLLAQRFWPALILLLLATSLHSSAALFLLLPAITTTGRGIGALLLRLSFLSLAMAALVVNGGLSIATERYVVSGSEAYGAQFRIAYLGLSGACYLIVLRRAWWRKAPHSARLIGWSSVMMLGLGAILPLSSVIADRLGYYLMPMQAMIVSQIPALHHQRWRLQLTLLPYLGLFALFAFWTLRSRHFSSCYMPYRNWLWTLG